MALVQSIRTGLGLSAVPAETDLGLEKEGLKIHFNHLKLDGAKVGVSFGSRLGHALGVRKLLHSSAEWRFTDVLKTTCSTTPPQMQPTS